MLTEIDCCFVSCLRRLQDILPAERGVKRKAGGRPPMRRDVGSGVLSGGGARRAGAADGDASVGVRDITGLHTPPPATCWQHCTHFECSRRLLLDPAKRHQCVLVSAASHASSSGKARCLAIVLDFCPPSPPPFTPPSPGSVLSYPSSAEHFTLVALIASAKNCARSNHCIDGAPTDS